MCELRWADDERSSKVPTAHVCSSHSTVASARVTHIFVTENLSAKKAQHYLEARRKNGTKLVTPEWAIACAERGKRVSEAKYAAPVFNEVRALFCLLSLIGSGRSLLLLERETDVCCAVCTAPGIDVRVLFSLVGFASCRSSERTIFARETRRTHSVQLQTDTRVQFTGARSRSANARTGSRSSELHPPSSRTSLSPPSQSPPLFLHNQDDNDNNLSDRAPPRRDQSRQGATIAVSQSGVKGCGTETRVVRDLGMCC